MFWSPVHKICFPIIHASAGITDLGAIIRPSYNSIFLNYAGSVTSGTNYDVTVTRTPYASLSSSGNRTSVAGALDGDASQGVVTGSSRYALLTRLDSLTSSQYQAALDTLSPEFYGAVSEATVRTARVLHVGVTDYLSQRRFVPAPVAGQAATIDQDKLDVFVQPTGMLGSRDNAYDRLGYNQNSYGILGGVARKFNKKWDVGVAGDYLHTRVNLNDGRGSADVDTLRVGPFIGRTFNNLFVDGSLSLAYHRMSMHRYVAVSGNPANSPNPAATPYDGTSNNNLNAYDMTVNADIGYRVKLTEKISLSPVASVAYTYFRRDGFTESGAPTGTNLDVSSQSFGDLRTALGAKLAGQYQFRQTTIVPEVSLAWAHSYLDQNEVSASFVGGTTPFTVKSGLGKTDGIVGSVGVSSPFAKDMSVFVRYSNDWTSQAQSNIFMAGLTISF